MSGRALVLLLTRLVAPPSGVEDVVLRDQRGQEDTLRAHRGQPTVALVVSARKLRSLRAWEQDLRKRCAGAAFVRIADVPREPVVTHEDVARKLRGRVPPEVSVLIDLEGAWVSAFRLDPSEVNALVFDREGRLQDRFRGRRGEALIARVVKALETAGACEAAR